MEGSRIAFHGTISRALSSAVMQPEGGKPAPLKIEGARQFSERSHPTRWESPQYTFNWRDDLGLSNAAPLRLSVAMQKDAPPMADLPGLPRETAMLVSDVLHIRAEASDDFGVRDLGLTWEVESDAPLTESITSEVKIMTASSRRQEDLRKFSCGAAGHFGFRPIRPSSCKATRAIIFPERERSRTAPYRIRVLSPEEHAETRFADNWKTSWPGSRMSRASRKKSRPTCATSKTMTNCPNRKNPRASAKAKMSSWRTRRTWTN